MQMELVKDREVSRNRRKIANLRSQIAKNIKEQKERVFLRNK